MGGGTIACIIVSGCRVVIEAFAAVDGGCADDGSVKGPAQNQTSDLGPGHIHATVVMIRGCISIGRLWR